MKGIAQGVEELHSNALNFVSAQVDPRTGQFGAAINLPVGAANALKGPSPALALGFNALLPASQGFGNGWQLGLSQWHSRTRRLSLSTGESYITVPGAGEEFELIDCKLPSFRLLTEGAGQLKILHKTGLAEYLASGATEIYRTVALRSPEGHRVRLEYTAGGEPRLERMIDDSGRVLLHITYSDGGASVRLFPEDDTRAAITLTFMVHEGQLREVRLPDDTAFSFGYLNHRSGLLLLQSFTWPMGGIQWVRYGEDLLALPTGAPMAHLPAVQEYFQVPGAGQPASESYFTYSLNNALGYGAVQRWSPHEDNLYRVLEDYRYSCNEIQYLENRPVRTIFREYNRFHLQTHERVVENGHVRETLTQYHDRPNLPFAQQPAYFQLPERIATRYWTAGAETLVREQIEQYRYDDSGNLIWACDSTGRVDEHQYFPVHGKSDACPADPLGFVRFLESSRSSPAAGTQGPIRVTRYSFTVLPATDGDFDHVVPRETWRTEVLDGVERAIDSRKEQFVIGGEHHGRMAWYDAICNGMTTRTAYHYSLVSARHQPLLLRPVPTLYTTTTIIGFDGSTLSSSEARSLVTSQRVLVSSEAGSTQVFDYDSLGRRVTVTRAPGTRFEASRSYLHEVSRDGSKRTTIGPTGVVSILSFDGLGREIQRQETSRQGGLYQAWEGTYNGLGQLVSSVEHEPQVPQVDGQLRDLRLETRYGYDHWGQLARTYRPDGVVECNDHDPITRVTETWLEAGGSVSERTTTEMDLMGRPLCTTQQHGNQAVVVERNEYDGVGRRVLRQDAEGNITQWAYDGFDRQVSSELGDGAVVCHTYARHGPGDMPTEISIEHSTLGAGARVLGTQAFDGLGRPVSRTVGGRETRYEYAQGYTQPERIISPGGRVSGCTYEPALDQALTSFVARHAAGPSETLVYDYHPLLGERVSATNESGTDTTVYDQWGQVDSETFLRDQVSCSRCYHYSAAGRQVGQCGIDGEQVTLRYDRFGRLASRQGADVTVAYAYDEYGRVAGVHTQTTQAPWRSLSQALEFDNVGREVCRTLVSQAAEAGTITEVIQQAYTLSSKLRERSYTLQGTLVRRDTFAYDVRGRMVRHASSGSEGPSDAQGNRFAQQDFTFDAVDNVTGLETQLVDGRLNRTTFGFSSADPTQLASIRHSLTASGYLPVDLSYDLDGNLEHDEQGRSLTYDAQGRLASVGMPGGPRCYRYDAARHLAAVDEGGSTAYRYYHNNVLSNECHVGTGGEIRYTHAQGHAVAQSQLANAVRQVTVLGSDSQGSVHSQVTDALLRSTYNAYGAQAVESGPALIGFAGQRREQGIGWYLLGGYRAYNPVLMRFHSPDVFSPFDKGGLNAYAYCSGDPVNRVDPHGTAWWKWLVAGVGTALGIMGTVLTVGAAVVLMGAIVAGGVSLTLAAAATTVAAGLGVISMWVGIASLSMEAAKVDSKDGEILGWVALGTGIASLGLEKAGSKLASSAMAAVDDLVDLPRDMGKVFNQEQGIYFTSKMYGSGLAYRTHGLPDHTLMNQAGVRVTPEAVAAEIATEISQVVPAPGPHEPLTLIACYGANGGANSPAKAVANYLERPVIAYLDVIGGPGVRSMEMPKGQRFQLSNGEVFSNNITRSGPKVHAAAAHAKQHGRRPPTLKRATPYRFLPDNWDWEAFPDG